MKRIIFAFAVLLSGTADAQMLSLGVTAPRYFGPCDVIAPTSWFGLKACGSAYLSGATNSVRLRRASDAAELDIVILSSGELDNATAATHCASTTCSARTVYDQISATACGGASCALGQATAGNQPAYVAECIGTRSCLSSSTNGMLVQSSNNFTPATGIASLAVVVNRSAGTGACALLRENGNNNRIVSSASANLWALAGTGTVSAAAPDAAWHAGVGTINGASSFFNVDGVVASGTVTGNTTAGVPLAFSGGTGTTCRQVAAGVWDNIVMTGAQRQTLQSVLRGMWGL